MKSLKAILPMMNVVVARRHAARRRLSLAIPKEWRALLVE
jgi:hypothetical protein